MVKNLLSVAGWGSLTFALSFFIFSLGCFEVKTSETVKPKAPHVVFVMGDDEYRSEESMPMLAEILKRELNTTISLCYAVDSAGFINPNSLDHIQGLEALETADLMVLFTRFRALPNKELKYITDYAESGKPMVGFRTSTHAFLYKDDSTKMHMNNEWPTKVFGQQWITHHGHFDDGKYPLTAVSILPKKSTHPILRGVTPFEANSWLYHVDGGDWKLFGDSAPLLEGRSLKSNKEVGGQLDQFPLSNPVAWTKSYTGTSGKASRVFFSTLGHPYDFKQTAMRKLALNGIYWALGHEKDIPEKGIRADYVSTYGPHNSGVGEKFRTNRRP